MDYSLVTQDQPLEKETVMEIENIRTREDLAQYVRELSIRANNPDENWENMDLYSFLEAMSGWIQEMDGYYKKIGKAMPKQPTWKTIAEILTAATVYE
jgi:hypothetical protein